MPSRQGRHYSVTAYVHVVSFPVWYTTYVESGNETIIQDMGVHVFSREISQLLKICPPLSLEESLKFIAMCVF